ncbi:MAG TPA: NAD(+)/NADH kinase [Actinomycetota bacterium]|nr:NAD(+)/NADH kinase [Actinomycetota bacterium]
MKTIGLVLHPTNPKAKEVAAAIREHGASRGLDVVHADEDDSPDAILALGGDGTLLRAAQIAWHLDVPVLGANLGTLGFLSTIDAEDVEDMVKKMITDIYRVEDRMMLEAWAREGDAEVCRVMALNEIVVERGTVSRVVKIRVRVGEETVARYIADGFIVATPTGSTAYSLSAGGPVMEPSVQAMLLTSVSAHTPLWRSIVVSPQNVVTLETPEDRVAFSADGQPVAILEPGATVLVRAHERPLKLLTAYRSHFYDKLRSRFHVEPND